MTTKPVTIRIAVFEDLSRLLDLYTHLHDEPPLAISPDTECLWRSILSHPGLRYVVAESEGLLASTCALTIVPNLTRGGQPYGLIENVVTHSDYRKRGFGTLVLRHALELAWEQSCYKVMLLTGRTDESVLRFYERAGFRRGVKTGFIAKPPNV